jgi:hypothetical protein
MNDNRTKRHDDLNRAFREGTVWDDSDDQLRTHIRTIAEDAIPNTPLAFVEIVRALVINHIQMARVIGELQETITRLNEDNGKVASRVKTLTWVCAICGIIQAFGVFWLIFRGP